MQKRGANMDFDAQAYPHDITIAGEDYKACRDMSTGELLVPYTHEPDIGVGDVITQKSGRREIQLRILDLSFQEESSLGIGTIHPHIMEARVESINAQQQIGRTGASTFNIGSINSQNVQIGDGNTLTIHSTLQELVEEVAASGDIEAKSKLKGLLENSTVGSLVGVGATALLNLL